MNTRKTLTVSAQTRELIRSCAIGLFNETGTTQPDGTYTFPVDDEVYAAVMRASKDAGPSIDDTLARLCAEYRTGGLQ